LSIPGYELGSRMLENMISVAFTRGVMVGAMALGLRALDHLNGVDLAERGEAA